MGTIQNSINQAMGAVMGGALAAGHVLDQVEQKQIQAQEFKNESEKGKAALQLENINTISENLDRAQEISMDNPEYTDEQITDQILAEKSGELTDRVMKMGPDNPYLENAIKARNELDNQIKARQALKFDIRNALEKEKTATPYFRRGDVKDRIKAWEGRKENK